VAPGPDPVPAISRIAMIVYEVMACLTGAGSLWWFIQGITRTRQIDAVRLMMIGWLSAWWLDPFLNFLRPMFTYNAYLFNRGSWCNFIPFWQSSHGGRYAEPLLVVGPAYFYNFAFTAYAGYLTMRAAHRRWPNLNKFGLAVASWPGILAAMGLLDVLATWTISFDAWPGTEQALSLWGGKYYQFPIYEFVIFPFAFMLCAFQLFYRDPAGLTPIEQGVDRVGGGAGFRVTLRVLALIAFCNLMNLGYTTTMGVLALHVPSWPANMPSWLANEQCGGITGIACH
jgi:hypothetical protein